MKFELKRDLKNWFRDSWIRDEGQSVISRSVGYVMSVYADYRKSEAQIVSVIPNGYRFKPMRSNIGVCFEL